MSILNTDFYDPNDDALYTDGLIEDEIYRKVCSKDMSIYNDSRWEMFYHFSPLRENILNWYVFDKGAAVLEIGGGCGALTGLLTQRCKNVVSCELTLKRAKIIQKRYEYVENLEVIVGNFLRIKFDQKFDYIIVNGVLEYAEAIMCHSKDAFKRFLAYIKTLLNEDGKVLLAIENKFGIKYFNGAPEDHTGIIFDGINGYITENEVRTFTKTELQFLCDSVNLSILKWFYPYPDYKFTSEIFTDESINQIFPLTKEVPFDQDRIELYDKNLVYKNMMDNGIMEYFSNSFLVELGTKPTTIERPSYIKINNNRHKKFALCTQIFLNQNRVVKKSLYKDGENHIKQMHIHGNEDINIIESEYNSGSITYPLIKNCETLHTRLMKYYHECDESNFWNELDKIRRIYCMNNKRLFEPEEEFKQVFGNSVVNSMLHWQNGVNIDLNIDNIFFQESKIIIIDNEWVFSFHIPMEYALWRMLMQLKESEPNLSWINTSKIMNFLQIREEDIKIFTLWEKHFAMNYVGIKDLSNMQKETYSISLNDILVDKKQKNIIDSKLFLFFENGEHEIISSYATIKDDMWVVSFSSENICKAQSIRWDPMEGNACRIYDIYIQNLLPQAINAFSEDNNGYKFITYDPQISIIGQFSGIDTIEIKFRCEILDWTFGYFQLEQEANLLKQEKDILKHQNNQLEQERDHLASIIDEFHQNPIKYIIKKFLKKRIKNGHN